MDHLTSAICAFKLTLTSLQLRPPDKEAAGVEIPGTGFRLGLAALIQMRGRGYGGGNNVNSSG